MLEVFCILVCVSISTSLVGSVLVLRQESMLADALSHSVLLGIVLGYFLSGDLDSPLLTVGAALFGLISVLLIDWISSRRLASDAATGLVFSSFFALAVLLISLFARNVHLDLDMVLMGEVLFAPLHRMNIGGLSLPVSLVKSGLLAIIILLYFILTYQPLKIFLSDPNQARLVGVRTAGLQLSLLFLVSLTTVISFDAVGSMTVIALLVAPSLISLTWSQSYAQLLLSSVLVGGLIVSIAFVLAFMGNVSISGTCACLCLVMLCLVQFCKKLLKIRN